MSINVYLKDGEVEKLDGFDTIDHRDGSKNYRVSRIDLWRETRNGRLYVVLHELMESIPTLVADIVEEISLHELFPSEPKREAGIYLHGSARAEVEPKFINGRMQNRVCATAKSMKDLRELYEAIRVGSILRPDKSYEGKQDGMSRIQLEKELERLQSEKTELNEKLTVLTEKANWFSRRARWLVDLFRRFSSRKN